MTITLYTSPEPVSSFNRTFTTVDTITDIKPFEAVDKLAPSFVLAYNAAYSAVNYCYIDTFDRFYYVNITYDNGGRMVLSCNVDPVYSWRNNIKQCPATVIRRNTYRGTTGRTLVTDGQYPVLSNQKDIKQVVSSNSALTPSGEWCYILTVLGGEIS